MQAQTLVIAVLFLIGAIDFIQGQFLGGGLYAVSISICLKPYLEKFTRSNEKIISGSNMLRK